MNENKKYFLIKCADIVFKDAETKEILFTQKKEIKKDEFGEYYELFLEDFGIKKIYLNEDNLE